VVVFLISVRVSAPPEDCDAYTQWICVYAASSSSGGHVVKECVNGSFVCRIRNSLWGFSKCSLLLLLLLSSEEQERVVKLNRERKVWLYEGWNF